MEGGGRVRDLRCVGEAGGRDAGGGMQVLIDTLLLLLPLLWVVDRVGVVFEMFREFEFLNRLPNIDVHCFALCRLDDSTAELQTQIQSVRRQESGLAHGSLAFLATLLLLRLPQCGQGERDAE